MNQLMTVERVENVEQVQRIVAPQKSGKTIANAPGHDFALAALSRFRSSHSFELRRLRCEIRDRTLIIRGQVSSYYLKQLAQETVRSLAGESKIVNRLEVVYPQTNQSEEETPRSQSLASVTRNESSHLAAACESFPSMSIPFGLGKGEAK